MYLGEDTGFTVAAAAVQPEGTAPSTCTPAGAAPVASSLSSPHWAGLQIAPECSSENMNQIASHCSFVAFRGTVRRHSPHCSPCPESLRYPALPLSPAWSPPALGCKLADLTCSLSLRLAELTPMLAGRSARSVLLLRQSRGLDASTAPVSAQTSPSPSLCHSPTLNHHRLPTRRPIRMPWYSFSPFLALYYIHIRSLFLLCWGISSMTAARF